MGIKVAPPNTKVGIAELPDRQFMPTIRVKWSQEENRAKADGFCGWPSIQSGQL